MRYKIEINHSLFRKSPQLEAIRDLILSDIGITNLNEDLGSNFKNEVSEIFSKLKLLYGKDTAVTEYLYESGFGDHLFIVSDAKIAKGRLSDYKTSLRKENTTLTYLRIKDGLIFKINRRYYPLSGSDKVMGINVPINAIFVGHKFIKSIFNERRINDTKDIWALSVPAIKTSINNLVELLSDDIRKFWYKTELTSAEAIYLVETVLESTHALLCLIEVNNAHFDFKPRIVSNDIAIEILDVTLGKFHSGTSPVEFAELVLYMSGKLAENLVNDDYQNLFRGFTTS